MWVLDNQKIDVVVTDHVQSGSLARGDCTYKIPRVNYELLRILLK